MPDHMMQATIRRPGHQTVRRPVKDWGEINDLVLAKAAEDAVLTVRTGEKVARYLIRFEGEKPELIKLAALIGLPENLEAPQKPGPGPTPGKPPTGGPVGPTVSRVPVLEQCVAKAA